MTAILKLCFLFGVAMSIQNFPDNVLYEMDNLLVLRGINSETIDLIATDPPFNTKRSRGSTAGFYVDNWKYGDESILPDQWKWNEVHPKWRDSIQDGYPELYQVVETTRVVQGEDTAAFLCFMSVRLLEMHRILKPTGSIYLHCDQTASHYIKAAMDAIFGKENFRNEIIWCYSTSGRSKKFFAKKHDTILLYTASKSGYWSDYRIPVSEKYLNSHYNQVDEQGRRCRIRVDAGKTRIYYPEDGMICNDWWSDIAYVNSQANERTGSPDQKPLPLYERIIEASSKENDIVLDPFCGCATTILAANNLNRRWIGIDRRKDARYHIITRLMGITRKQRADLEKKAQYNNQAWLDKQTARYEMHYQTEPPIRTDNGEQNIAELPAVYIAKPENYHSRDEMREILIQQFGVECWGCGFQPPDNDKRYLHLDHINPKSSGGSNEIDNRSILCQPCNSAKSNTMTLDGLRRKNKREQLMKKPESQLIDILSAVTWSRNLLDKLKRDSIYQKQLDFSQ